MTTLVVPIECEALVANSGVLARDALRWWPFNYAALNNYRSPQPMPLDRAVSGQRPGVYLHWTLPLALRTGTGKGQGVDGQNYPLVPNRWLVLRVQGDHTRTAKGWVLESDCPVTPQVKADAANSAQWLVDEGVARLWSSSGDPRRTAWKAPTDPDAVSVANIGVAFDLPDWQEAAGASMFLTAVAPANPLFSGYLPHHGNVFGFHDTLDGVTNDRLSYYVVGWYSDPAQDVASKDTTEPEDFARRLGTMGWALTGGGTAKRSAYVGGCFNIGWQSDGQPPSPDPLQEIRDTGRLNVSVGNTTIDAFSALVSQQVTEPGTATLLRAFNYDLLPVLNEVNGDALLQERIRQEWFGSTEGGTRWIISEVSSEDGNPAAKLTAAEQAWLAELNENQSQLDAAMADVFALQWTVNALWYKRNWLGRDANTFPEPPAGAPSVADLDVQLNPDRSGSAAANLLAALARAGTLFQRVPRPDWTASTTHEQAFHAGIAAFARAKGLDPSKRLKATAMPRFWQPNNPVVVVSGVRSPYAAEPDQTLAVRLDSQVVTGFRVAGGSVSREKAAAAFAGLPALGHLPAFVAPLVDELFLVDRTNAQALATASGVPANAVAEVLADHPAEAYQGTLPRYPLGDWKQPWQPLLMEWRASYVPLEGEDAWAFDGTDYRATGAGAGKPTTVGGISLLSPHAQFVFGSRLKSFLDKYAANQPDLRQLYEQIAQVFHWEFLAQELSGFNDTLALRDRRPFRRPRPDQTVGAGRLHLAELLGYADPRLGPSASNSQSGQLGSVPLIPNGPPLPFQGVRAGQFNFIDLILYDRFGRVLNVISSRKPAGLYDADDFPAVVDRPLVPASSAQPRVKAMVELPPRLIQPGRLDIQLVDKGYDDRLVSHWPGAVPVCGWVLPNHLDGGLLLYGPDGTSLGELRLLVGLDGGTKTARWLPPPHSDITDVNQLGRVSPHLLAFVTSPELQREDNFRAFLDAIDSSLWTIDPLGGRADQNLSVLIGRPLALVRLRLQLQMQGRPLADTGWKSTLNPPPPEWLNRRFAIRLGDQATRQDGTIGYFTGTDYGSFNSVVAPKVGGQNFVRQIGPQGGGNYLSLGFKEADYAYVTVLMDPRAAVHASTGLFPVKALELPQRFTDRPLSNMEVSFRVGPILTSMQSSPGTGEGSSPPPDFPQAISLPMPAEQNGTWSWWEKSVGQAWTGYDVVGATPDAKLLPVPNSLREGAFQLRVNLKTSRS